MFIDVHCHLTGDEYDEKGGVEGYLQRAKEQGVNRVICSGFDLASSVLSLQIAERYENVYFCAGIHPSDVGKAKEGDLEALEKLASHEKCVAIGEIGFDFHFPDNPDRETQREYFLKQLIIAEKTALPVVIHSRDAAEETVSFLQKHAALLRRGGLMHCYAYSKEMVPIFEKLGLYFSFGGTSTFKNARKVWESAKAATADRILTETDAPYLTPEPLRGRFPNGSENIPYILKNLAFLRGEKEEELKERVFANAKTLFPKLR